MSFGLGEWLSINFVLAASKEKPVKVLTGKGFSEHLQFVPDLLNVSGFKVKPMGADGLKDTFCDIFLRDENRMWSLDVSLWHENQRNTLILTEDVCPNDSGWSGPLERDFLDDAVFHRPPP
jgi:hypothetical protein